MEDFIIDFTITPTEITADETQYDHYFNELYAPCGHVGFKDIDKISCYLCREEVN